MEIFLKLYNNAGEITHITDNIDDFFEFARVDTILIYNIKHYPANIGQKEFRIKLILRGHFHSYGKIYRQFGILFKDF